MSRTRRQALQGLAGLGLTATGLSAAASPAQSPANLLSDGRVVPASMTSPLPSIAERADPQVQRTDDGRYWMTATVPEYDRIELRCADSLSGLAATEPVVVWRRHAHGPMSWHIWAPELHRIDGRWYLYFSAGRAEAVWQIRLWVLACRSDDPLAGPWDELGQLPTHWDSFTLDATTFAHRGTRYLVWAQHDPSGPQSTDLWLAPMASPQAIQGPPLRLSRPEFGWERVRHAVNEAPAVLVQRGRVFIAYSASGTGPEYALGLLWADASADLMAGGSWSKSPSPVLSSQPDLGLWGPGHNSFFTGPDGQPWHAFHARSYRDIVGDPLKDRGRATHFRPLRFGSDGLPDLALASPPHFKPVPKIHHGT